MTESLEVKTQLAWFGSLFVSTRSEILEYLPKPEWFQDKVDGIPLTEVAYIAINLVQSGETVTPASLVREVKSKEVPWAGAFERHFLPRAMSSHTELGGLPSDYYYMLREHWEASRAAQVAVKLAQTAEAGGDWRIYAQKLGQLANALEKDEALSTVDALDEIFSWSKPHRLKVISGLSSLDEMVHIFEGDLVILGARTSHGKTSLAIQFARANAARGLNVVYYSSEMTAGQIAARLASQTTGIPLSTIIQGQVKPGSLEAEQIKSALQKHKFTIIKTNRVHDVLVDLSRRFSAGKADFAIVDFVQDFSLGRSNLEEYERISYFVRELKSLAQRYGKIVLGTAQINREATKGKGEPPKRSQLKGSGTFEETADTVLLLWRRPLDDTGIPGNEAEIIVAKQRNGMTGVADAIFAPKTAQFVSL